MNPPKAKILLVESDADLRGATRELLAEMGYRVTSVTRPSEAVELHARRPDEFSLVLLDAYLSSGDGLELVDRLRQVTPDLPAVLLSGFGADDALRARVLEGRVGFLAMPFSAERLEGELQEALGQQRLRLIGRPAARRDEPVPKKLIGRLLGLSSVSPWRLAIAGLALAVIGLTILGRLFGPPRLPPPPTEEVYRSSRIEPVEPVGGLNETPVRLVWSAFPGAGHYDLSLSGVDGEVVWRVSATAPPFGLPIDLRERLAAGVIYYWSVEAFDESGARAAASPATPFWIEPAGEAGGAATATY